MLLQICSITRNQEIANLHFQFNCMTLLQLTTYLSLFNNVAMAVNRWQHRLQLLVNMTYNIHEARCEQLCHNLAKVAYSNEIEWCGSVLYSDAVREFEV